MMKLIDPDQLEENAEKASSLLKSMSHPSRLMVLCHLMNGEYPVSALRQAIPLSQSALSQHLASLREAGLVATRRERQVIHYRLNSNAVAGILQTLYRIYCNPNDEEQVI
jgi:DNA-binding transcriptional ArsR family regulator